MSGPAGRAVAAFDRSVDRLFDAHLRGRGAADAVMYAGSALGDHGIIWFVLAGIQHVRRRRRGEVSWRPFLRTAAAIGVESAVVNGPVKWIFRRSRPDAAGPRPQYLRQPRTSSFPSGHATSAFCAAALLRDDDPLWPLYYAVAVVVASSRVHVRIHHAVRRLRRGADRHRPGPAGPGAGAPPTGRLTLPAARGRNLRGGGAVAPDMTAEFAVTWDYRCPFARIAHDHLVAGLQAGADWDVRFAPFSLDQAHVAEGDQPVWDDPGRYQGLVANEVGIVVRDRWPERFLDVHRALFKARHEEARDTRSRQVLDDVLNANGVDASAVFAEIDEGWPLEVFRKEHEALVADHQVFGVPTFIVGTQAVFVRLLDGPNGDGGVARETVDKVIALLGWTSLNEFKHTTLSR